jgi:hypothetical protein
LDIKNKDIFDKPQNGYEKGCVSCTWGGKWAKPFRESRRSLADDRRSGRPPIPDRVERIRANVEYEPYQPSPAMARDLGLSKTYVLEVHQKVLQLKKYLLHSLLQILNGD